MAEARLVWTRTKGGHNKCAARWTLGLELPGEKVSGRPERRCVHVARKHMKLVGVREDAAERFNGSGRLAAVTPGMKGTAERKRKKEDD